VPDPGRRPLISDPKARRSDWEGRYLDAFHHTTLDLMRRLAPRDVLEGIVNRAAALLGTGHGYLCLTEPDGSGLRVAVGTGVFQDRVGMRLARGEGVGGRVLATGRPVMVDDYDTFENRASALPRGQFTAVVGVPLLSGSEVVGVIGLARVEPGPGFAPADVQLLTRFGQLASLALDNARLHEASRQEVAHRIPSEARLRESEELYRQVFESSNAIKLLIDPLSACIVDANRAASEFYGYTREELQRMPIAAINQMSPEDLRGTG